MKKSISQQKHNCPNRTMETLDADFQKFVQKGQIPKLAKYCKNVIDSPLFNIPLTQVLHLSTILHFYLYHFVYILINLLNLGGDSTLAYRIGNLS